MIVVAFRSSLSFKARCHGDCSNEKFSSGKEIANMTVKEEGPRTTQCRINAPRLRSAKSRSSRKIWAGSRASVFDASCMAHVYLCRLILEGLWVELNGWHLSIV